MPRKKSVKRSAREFAAEIEKVREFIQSASFSTSPETFQTYIHDLALVRLYRAFQKLMLEALVGAINNDTSTLSAKTGLTFPKHLTDEVCEYLITGGSYFDFRGYGGLIQVIKDFVPGNHYLLTIVPKHKAGIERLSGLRNFAAHESKQAKQAALAATGMQKMSDSGSWLKRQGRLESLFQSLTRLGTDIEQAAPY